MEGVLTQEKYEEVGEISHFTPKHRFGSWNNAKQKAGLETISRGDSPPIDDQWLERIEESLLNKHGRYEIQEIMSYIKEQTGKGLRFSMLSSLWEQINMRENSLLVTQSTNGPNGHRVFIRNENVDPYRDFKEKLPDGTEHVFEQCIGHGQTPRGVLAALLYLDNENLTQAEAAEEAGTYIDTLRRSRDMIVEQNLLTEYPGKGDT